MTNQQKNFSEYHNRGGIVIVGLDFVDDTLIIDLESKMRSPNKLDIFLGYVTLCIPAAIFARVTRKITGRKGTPLEKHLMKYYFDMSVKLLRKDK